MSYEFHEYANLFPLMAEDQLSGLVESVGNGFNPNRPIAIFQGKILDGRNRYLACQKANVTPIFKEFIGSDDDALQFVKRENLDRNHYNEAQRAMVGAKLKSLYEERAKERQRAAGGDHGNQYTGGKVAVSANLRSPTDNGKSAEKAAETVNVSTRSVENATKVIERGAPELVRAVEQGKIAVSTAAAITELPKAEQKEVAELTFDTGDSKQNKENRIKIVEAAKRATEEKKIVRQQVMADPAISDYILLDDWSKLSDQNRRAYLDGVPTKKTFNKQNNDSIEWAQWSWNPITGCRHDCAYCYARDIANRFYEQKFEPSFVPDRIAVPGNTPVPKDAKTDVSYKNVFVCSMADLFGRWVPNEWIESVLNQVSKNPQWNFLFLTKFPKRLVEFEFPVNAWMGTTVDCQARVKSAEDAFSRIGGGTKWLSIEPLLQPLKFERLDLFDWIAIGGSSRSTQTPEWIPPFDWVSCLHQDARAAGCRIYHKSNLGLLPDMRVKEFPWVDPVEKSLPEAFRYLPSLREPKETD